MWCHCAMGHSEFCFEDLASRKQQREGVQYGVVERRGALQTVVVNFHFFLLAGQASRRVVGIV